MSGRGVHGAGGLESDRRVRRVLPWQAIRHHGPRGKFTLAFRRVLREAGYPTINRLPLVSSRRARHAALQHQDLLAEDDVLDGDVATVRDGREEEGDQVANEYNELSVVSGPGLPG